MNLEKVKTNTKKFGQMIASGAIATLSPLTAFAAGSDNFGMGDIQMGDLDNLGNINQVGATLISFMLWAFRIVGIVMAAWGVYGFFTARRDGDGQELNSAIFKILAGIVLVAMKFVLQAFGILA